MSIRISKIVVGTLVLAPVLNAAADEKPNIVYILADDLGYGDIHCFNPSGKILTPNIDALAAEGESFTDAHSAASVCTPSRYGLLTGRYPWRTRLQRGVLSTGVPASSGKMAGCEPLIKKEVLTVPQFLKNNGYDTAIFGKWHLGFWYEFPEGKSIVKGENGGSAAPIGTKVISGPITRGFDIFKGYHHAREMGTWISQDKVIENIDPKDMSGRIADAAVDYIKQPERADKPFFIYIPLNSPHTPILPTKEWEGKSGINIYADYVMETDAAVGKIISAIDSAGFKDDTIIFFSSDNGASYKADFPALLAAGHNPSSIFRGAKSDIWEGGHRVPFIVCWPEVVKAGSTCKDPICLTSLLATVADILRVQLPEGAGVDSFSILPDMTNPDSGDATHKIIIHQSAKGMLAVREGHWKFIAGNGSGGWAEGGDDKPFQLYDMDKDMRERNNLFQSKPEVVESLKNELNKAVQNGSSADGKKGENDIKVETFKKIHSGRSKKRSNHK